MKRRRGKKVVSYDEDTDGLSPPERICSLLRAVQWETNCSTLTLQNILDSLHGRLGEAIRQCKTSGCDLPRSAKSADRKMQDTVCFNQFSLF